MITYITLKLKDSWHLYRDHLSRKYVIVCESRISYVKIVLRMDWVKCRLMDWLQVFYVQTVDSENLIHNNLILFSPETDILYKSQHVMIVGVSTTVIPPPSYHLHICGSDENLFMMTFSIQTIKSFTGPPPTNNG